MHDCSYDKTNMYSTERNFKVVMIFTKLNVLAICIITY